ncbi:MAG: pyrroloquinoline quinone-dependent dehydrogenase [Candidatus Hydrogenedentota bacterium]
MIFIRRAVMLCLLLPAIVMAQDNWRTEWHHYAHDPGGARFSPLAQINASNVANLERAWTFRTGDIGEGGSHYAECTPLMVDGILYLITPFSRLIALDAITGEEQWRFSPDPPLANTETGAGGLASRGVTYWSSGDKKRIFLPVRDGRLYSIDIDTRKPDPTFGKNGHINLRDGLPEGGGYLFLSSPPAIHENVLVQPYGMDDTFTKRVPYVPVRAFDTHTGELRWTFNTIPQPSEFGHDTWTENSWQNRGGCNPWTAISVDNDYGHFYLATGAPNNDKYGGDRHGDNLFANSLIALDAKTGKRVWHFQTVHHDLWDYDLPAQPNLVDLTVHRRQIPAVSVVGKTGFVYLFDRRDGKPVFPIEERPVPKSNIPGEAAAATQPFPTKPAAFARQFLQESDLLAFDEKDAENLLEKFSSLRVEGLFTPPSKQGSIVLPGQLGGANWSGASVSPDGYMYVTANELPYFSKMRMSKSPFGASPAARHFRDKSGWPGIKPPWGTLTKLNLNNGTLVWQVPLGDEERLDQSTATGQMNFGGATATRGGLVFAAASMDGKFWAFSAASGETLFETQLEAAGHGAPISYEASNGKQYIVIFAGGGGKGQSPKGDYVIAFTLK